MSKKRADNSAVNNSDVDTLEDITHRLGRIGADDFERLCCELLKREFSDWSNMEPRVNALGKSTPGTPDAHVRLQDGSYVAFQFTTVQESASDRRSVQRKVLEDIAKIRSTDCLMGDKTVVVVVCVNTQVGDEREAYHKAAKDNGWKLEVFSVHRLAPLVAKHPDLADHFLRTKIKTRESTITTTTTPTASSELSDDERGFEAGARVRKVREEIGLDYGRFIEAVGLKSERILREIEQGMTECPESLLTRVASVSGASLEWLKFGSISGTGGTAYGGSDGEEARYPKYDLTLCNLEADLKALRAAQPDRVYFCVELRSYTVMLLTQTGDHYWRTFDLGIQMLWGHQDESSLLCVSSGRIPLLPAICLLSDWSERHERRSPKQ